MKTHTSLSFTQSLFCDAYITCALWSSTDNASDSGGEPLDDNYCASDIAPDTLEQMRSDCLAFLADNGSDLEAVDRLCSVVRAGHNFWLNRNGHGSGFWDEYFGDDKELRASFIRLSDASKACGSFDLYIGDDGQIHGS